jgi:hypothetical protein
VSGGSAGGLSWNFAALGQNGQYVSVQNAAGELWKSAELILADIFWILLLLCAKPYGLLSDQSLPSAANPPSVALS